MSRSPSAWTKVSVAVRVWPAAALIENQSSSQAVPVTT